MTLQERECVTESIEKPIHTTLKWFNKSKGFGFVVPVDNKSKDAFIHITTLFDAKCEHLGDDAEFMCVIDEGPKGLIVKEITEVISEGNPNTGVRIKEPDNLSQKPESGETYKLDGEVKWYRPEKGFGFIIPADGDKDVFIHKKCLEQNGMESLNPGQKITMQVRAAPKGREVVSFEVND